jgi:pentapeptide MXKDX repeat protein
MAGQMASAVEDRPARRWRQVFSVEDKPRSFDMRKIGLVIAAAVVGLGLSLAIVGCTSSTTESKDKMGVEKMGGDKMKDDKMKDDTMKDDKMGGDKMKDDKMKDDKK